MLFAAFAMRPRALFMSLSMWVSVAAAEDQAIVQKDKAFLPGNITLTAGDRLVFQNDDGVAHNAFSSTAGFNLQIQPPGTSQSVTLEKVGTHEIRCAIHPKMMLTVTVLPAPAPVSPAKKNVSASPSGVPK